MDTDGFFGIKYNHWYRVLNIHSDDSSDDYYYYIELTNDSSVYYPKKCFITEKEYYDKNYNTKLDGMMNE